MAQDGQQVGLEACPHLRQSSLIGRPQQKKSLGRVGGGGHRARLLLRRFVFKSHCRLIFVRKQPQNGRTAKR